MPVDLLSVVYTPGGVHMAGTGKYVLQHQRVLINFNPHMIENLFQHYTCWRELNLVSEHIAARDVI